jgi:hypothetical protein
MGSVDHDPDILWNPHRLPTAVAATEEDGQAFSAGDTHPKQDLAGAGKPADGDQFGQPRMGDEA